MFELKRLSEDAVESAVEKAVRYRLLNQPRLAESICRDVLSVRPDLREAVITLILSLSDQLAAGTAGCSAGEIIEFVPRLEDEYDRQYYEGIVCERRAVGQLRITSPGSGHIAYDWFRRAMTHFEAAESIRPAGNDDALLRWNTCARIINARADLRSAPEERIHSMLE
jgi:hypothetical protein